MAPMIATSRSMAMISKGSAYVVKIAVAMALTLAAAASAARPQSVWTTAQLDQPRHGQGHHGGDRQLAMERSRQVRVPGLREHDREQDQHADRAEVDEHLRGSDDRRA